MIKEKGYDIDGYRIK